MDSTRDLKDLICQKNKELEALYSEFNSKEKNPQGIYIDPNALDIAATILAIDGVAFSNQDIKRYKALSQIEWSKADKQVFLEAMVSNGL